MVHHTFEGRLATEPKFYRKQNRAWCRVATDHPYSEIINVSVFGHQARNLIKHGTKGKRIKIIGEMKEYFDGGYGDSYKEVTATSIMFGGDLYSAPPPRKPPCPCTCPLVQGNWDY